jgi:VWFA-related protein
MFTKCSFIIVLLSAVVVQNHAQDQKISFDFAVIDGAGKFVPNLKAEDFRLAIGKQATPLLSLSAVDNQLEVIVLIDASTSQERVLPNEKIAAEKFIDSILRNDRDIVAVAKFKGYLELVQDSTHDFDLAISSLRKIVFEPPPGYVGGGVVFSSKPAPPDPQGSTSVWDTVVKASEALARSGSPKNRKLIVLISDGVNTYGDAKLSQSIAACVRNKTPVFAIGMSDENYNPVDVKSLRRISNQTGGLAVFPKKKIDNIEEQVASMRDAARNTYRAEFAVSSLTSGLNLTELKIELISPQHSRDKLTLIQPVGFIHP